MTQETESKIQESKISIAELPNLLPIKQSHKLLKRLEGDLLNYSNALPRNPNNIWAKMVSFKEKQASPYERKKK